MSYAVDLARAHKERLARIWPAKSPPPLPMVALTSAVEMLEKQKQKLLKEIDDLRLARDGFAGEQRLLELRDRVCADHGIHVSMFVSTARSKLLVIARKQFAQEARSMGASLPRIAYHIGGRNHATIFYYIHGKKRKAAEPAHG